MAKRILQKPGRPDELPSPQPPETPPLEPDRIDEPGLPETPPAEPEQPVERPPEYPVPDETSASVNPIWRS